MAPHIWSQLHNLRHVDHSFKEVSNDFVYPDSYEEVFNWNDTNKYQESIQMFIALCAIFGALFIVLISCFACCCNYVRSGEAEDADDDPNLLGYQHVDNANRRVSDVTTELSKFAKYIRWFFSALILIGIVLSFVFVFILNDTIKDVQSVMNDSYEPYSVCISNGKDINDTLNDAIKQCEIIKSSDQITTDISNDVDEIESDLQSSTNYIITYLDEGDNIEWEDSGSSIDSHREQLFYVCIGLTCFTLVIVTISICTSVKISVCNGIVSLLVTFGMVVLWIIASVQFGVSVEVADICADPNDAVVQAINHTSYDTDNETIAIVKYYIYCDDEYPNNPLIRHINSAYDEILGLNDSLTELQTLAQGSDVESNVNALISDYNASLYEMVALNKSLNCDNIYDYYVEIQNDMCYDLLDEWYALYVLQFIIVGFLVLRLCFTCRAGVNRRVANYFVKHSHAGPYREYYNEDPIELGNETRGNDTSGAGARYAL